MAELPFPKSSTGIVYPTNYVVAIIDHLDDARHAIIDLQRAGFAEKDIVLVTNAQGEEIVHDYEQHRTTFNRIMQAVADVVSDESQYDKIYSAAAHAGHHVLCVQVTQRERQDNAIQIMKAHHGHTVKFFGKFAITNFP